jgi:hypothetical protein
MSRFVLVRCMFFLGIAASVFGGDHLWCEDPASSGEVRATPVTRQEVWRAVATALRERGLEEQKLPRMQDLDVPAAPPAAAERTLRVASACWDVDRQHAQFRLECGAPGQCLPFLVYLPNYMREAVAVDVSAHAASCRAAQFGERTPARAGPRTRVDGAAGLTVHTGDRATAVFLADRLRMTASVTCLERGREGDVIRVRAPDGHIFRARVSGPGMLEAVLQ